jgi:hypothetical protein
MPNSMKFVSNNTSLAFTCIESLFLFKIADSPVESPFDTLLAEPVPTIEESPAVTLVAEPEPTIEGLPAVTLPPAPLPTTDESHMQTFSEPPHTPEESAYATVSEPATPTDVVVASDPEPALAMEHPVLIQDVINTTTDPFQLSHTVPEHIEVKEEPSVAEFVVKEEPSVAEFESMFATAEVVGEPAVAVFESLLPSAEVVGEPAVAVFESLLPSAEVVGEPAVAQVKSVAPTVEVGEEVKEEPAVAVLESVPFISEVEEVPAVVAELDSMKVTALMEVKNEPDLAEMKREDASARYLNDISEAESGDSGDLSPSLQRETLPTIEVLPAPLADRKQAVSDVSEEVELAVIGTKGEHQLNHLTSTSDPSLSLDGAAPSPAAIIAVNALTKDSAPAQTETSAVKNTPPKNEKFVVLSTERGKIILMNYDS